jgi:hypothetical protein
MPTNDAHDKDLEEALQDIRAFQEGSGERLSMKATHMYIRAEHEDYFKRWLEESKCQNG